MTGGPQPGVSKASHSSVISSAILPTLEIKIFMTQCI